MKRILNLEDYTQRFLKVLVLDISELIYIYDIVMQLGNPAFLFADEGYLFTRILRGSA